MAIENGGFEEAGAAPGLAQGWTSTFVSSLEEWADFAQNPSEIGITSSQEGLERGWTGSDDQAFVAEFVGETIDVEAAIFNVGVGQLPVERFERDWGIVTDELASMQPAVFSSLDQERFEAGWGTVELVLQDSAVAAVFDGESREDFEDGWNNTAFELGSTESAVFGSSGSFETFEDVAEPIEFTTAVTADTMELVEAPDEALANGDRASVANEGGALPTPLKAGVLYYLVGVSGETFQLAPTLGADEIDLTDAGSGVNRLARDPALWWSTVMTTV